ncbi:hypothetical protein CSB07_00900 [Candidatus Gracilibacteria bacterium]|nr:MAG: hypothetical protein CSB07_00900 [Candidatus Gracilibacteria bacterium]PIE85781.1 MAG: hypothetical protein CSA08_00310 [Candidatus Gracilibacteria bacterium]
MIIKLIKKKLTFLWLIILCGFTIGAYSFLSIPKEDTPALELPMFVVNTINYGGSPEIIEVQITNKLEDEFKSISGIKKIESVSNFNFSTIIATFNDNKDIDEAKSDLKDSIDEVLPYFPKNTVSPIVKQINPSDSPIYSFGISSNKTSKDLYALTKDLEDSLKGIEGVSEILTIGKPDKKISVYLDYAKLNQYGINISQISKILSGIFINQSVDKKDIGGNLYSYEIITFSKDINKLLDQIRNTDVLNLNSQSIKIGDIASIFFEEISESELSYIMKGNDIFNTVSFDIKITPGSDIESIIKNIKSKINTWEKSVSGIKVFETYSKMTKINSVYGTFVSNFRQTGITILIILFLFIGVRISLGVTITFPLVYLITFIILKSLGYTFNSIVSFALVLTLGIMVDNLIVITEGIVNEFHNNKNIKFWQAASNTLDKYMWSIIPGTLITVFMFLPIMFMLGGNIGQFIGPLSITIAITLITSLAVSILLLPVILNKILPKNIEGSSGVLTAILNKVGKGISNFTKKILKSKFRSFMTIIVFWGTLFLSIFLIGTGVIKTDFMPATDRDNVFINIKYPLGYSLNKNAISTNKILYEIKKYLDSKYKNEIEYIYVNIGNNYSTSAIGTASNPTADFQAYLNIKLTPGDDRDLKSFIIGEDIQNYIDSTIKKKFNYIKDISIVPGMSVGGGKDVGFYIIGDDVEKIASYLAKIRPSIEKIDGIFNIYSNYEFTNGKISYKLDINKVLRNKIPLPALIQLFASIENSDYIPNGLTVHNFTEFGDENIPLKLYTKYNGNVEDIKIGSNFVANVTKERELEPELKNIQHIDGKIQLSIDADKRSDTPLGVITKQIDKIINDNPLPEGLKFRYNSNIEDSSSSSAELGSALLVGVLLMFFILVLKFNSFKYSIIILSSTFLSFIGVVFALGIMGIAFSFPAQLGLFGVIGVGVNNAILFLDGFFGVKDLALKKALLITIQNRFVPIFLTSSTTIAGLITLALKDELWGSLAIAFIGGLVLNVFMILIYLPALLFITTKNK